MNKILSVKIFSKYSFIFLVSFVLSGCKANGNMVSEFILENSASYGCGVISSKICVVGDDWTQLEFDKVIDAFEAKRDKLLDENPIYLVKRSKDGKIVGEVTYRIRTLSVKKINTPCDTWSGNFFEYILTFTAHGPVFLDKYADGNIDPALCAKEQTSLESSAAKF